MSRGRGRPINEDKRQAIVCAAQRHFLEKGLRATRLDDVARDADVSKTTIYNAFGDKGNLFDVVVSEIAQQLERALRGVSVDTDPIDQTLHLFGIDLLTQLTSDQFIRLDVILAASGAETIETSTRFYAHGPGRVLATLADYLERCAARGELRVTDKHQAAEDLVALWRGLSPMKRRFKQIEPASAEDLERRVQHGLSIFFAVYGAASPNQDADPERVT